MRIRIVYDPGSKHLHTSRIEDADTGEVVKGVRVVKFEHTAGEWPCVTLELIREVSVEVVTEGDLEDISEVGDAFRRMRLVPRREAAVSHQDLPPGP